MRELAVTTLITLHDLNLAAAYCDEVVMLERSLIVSSGSPREVFTPETLRQVFGVHAAPLVNPLTGPSPTCIGRR